jgi:hypothetical protein
MFRESDFPRPELIVRATFDRAGQLCFFNPWCSIRPHLQIQRRDEIGPLDGPCDMLITKSNNPVTKKFEFLS